MSKWIRIIWLLVLAVFVLGAIGLACSNGGGDDDDDDDDDNDDDDNDDDDDDDDGATPAGYGSVTVRMGRM